MENDSTPDIGAQLKSLRLRAGLNLRQMALRLDLAGASSWQKYEEIGSRDRGLSISIVQRIAKALVGEGNPPITLEDLSFLIGPNLKFDSPAAHGALYDLLGLTIPPSIARQLEAANAPVRPLPVVGNVQASFWMAEAPTLDVPEATLPIPFVTGYPEAEQYALRVLGPSMNKVVQEGSYVICVRSDGYRDVPHGKLVHVQRESPAAGIEWTLKRMKWDGSGPTLWPESTNPAYQMPLPLGDGEDTTVKIVGVVIGIYTLVP